MPLNRAVDWHLVPVDWIEFVRFLVTSEELGTPVNALDALDVFAGSKSYARACERAGLLCMTYEINDDDVWQDFLTFQGLSYLIQLVVRVKPGGLVVFGPPCKYWIFLTLSHTRRIAKNPAGDASSWMARAGNSIASRLAQVLHLCQALNIDFVVEQPSGSFMPQYQPMSTAIDVMRLTAITFKMSVFGHECTKPTRLWGSASWLDDFSKYAAHLPMPQSTKKLADQVGDAVNGRAAELEASAAYTAGFCEALLRFHVAARMGRGQKRPLEA
jgi:hypothetical protein